MASATPAVNSIPGAAAARPYPAGSLFNPNPNPNSTATASTSSSRLSTGSNNTYVMTGSPRRNGRKRNHEPYMPKIITTVGQRPACLVNASVTYVGNDQIYAFGGFDQYTDEGACSLD